MVGHAQTVAPCSASRSSSGRRLHSAVQELWTEVRSVGPHHRAQDWIYGDFGKSSKVAQRLELEEVLALRLVQNFGARRAHRLRPLGRRVGRDVGERHVENAPAVVEFAWRDAKVGIFEPARSEHRLEALALQPQHVLLEPLDSGIVHVVIVDWKLTERRKFGIGECRRQMAPTENPRRYPIAEPQAGF